MKFMSIKSPYLISRTVVMMAGFHCNNLVNQPSTIWKVVRNELLKKKKRKRKDTLSKSENAINYNYYNINFFIPIVQVLMVHYGIRASGLSLHKVAPEV